MKITWSDESFRIFGFEPDKNATKRHGSLSYFFLYGSDRQNVIEALDNTLKGLHPLDVEYWLFLQDGRQKYIREKADIHINAAGEPHCCKGDLSRHHRKQIGGNGACQSKRKLGGSNNG